MKKVAIIRFAACLFCFYQFVSAHQTVYLLHGYGSAPLFMTTIDNYLKKQDLKTVNYGYHSIKDDLSISGRQLYEDILKNKEDTVCFVTHSMGALVLRSMLSSSQKDSAFPVIYRIVMITPPNHGAEIANFFGESPVLRYILGPNLQHLMTDSSSLANHLPVPGNCEIGIIIGVRAGKNGYNPFIKGDNDGYLTPNATRLGTEKESVFIPSEHSMIIHNKRVLELVYSFLKNGNFDNSR
jgi:triacylglycerol lipase